MYRSVVYKFLVSLTGWVGKEHKVSVRKKVEPTLPCPPSLGPGVTVLGLAQFIYGG